MLFPPEAYIKVGIPDDFCLLELKDFQGLLPKAHDAGVPVFALTTEQLTEQGTVLEGLEQNRSKFYEVFKHRSYALTDEISFNIKQLH
ncbi:MAG: hypothetical protein HC877_02805 [Thioploca sp.]|nr:hypothetical protein [Thioploca sp.]